MRLLLAVLSLAVSVAAAPQVKALVMVAAEIRGRRMGRIRLQVVPDASGPTLLDAVEELAEPRSNIVTDGWLGYSGLSKRKFHHTISRHDQSVGENLLPHVDLVASLLKRWLLGTHHGAIRHHLPQYYLDEFVFRFNRRTSASRGLLFYRLLQQAVIHPPVPVADLNP